MAAADGARQRHARAGAPEAATRTALRPLSRVGGDQPPVHDRAVGRGAADRGQVHSADPRALFAVGVHTPVTLPPHQPLGRGDASAPHHDRRTSPPGLGRHRAVDPKALAHHTGRRIPQLDLLRPRSPRREAELVAARGRPGRRGHHDGRAHDAHLRGVVVGPRVRHRDRPGRLPAETGQDRSRGGGFRRGARGAASRETAPHEADSTGAPPRPAREGHRRNHIPPPALRPSTTVDIVSAQIHRTRAPGACVDGHRDRRDPPGIGRLSHDVLQVRLCMPRTATWLQFSDLEPRRDPPRSAVPRPARPTGGGSGAERFGTVPRR